MISDKKIVDILMDMTILCDTREQKNSHILDYFKTENINYRIETLKTGDYTFILPNYPMLNLDKKFIVERKGSLDELASNFTRGRDRFTREFERLEDDMKIHLVLENFTLKKLKNKSYRSNYSSNSYIASLLTWCIRYNCPVWNTTTYESAWVIYKILYYELYQYLNKNKSEIEL